MERGTKSFHSPRRSPQTNPNMGGPNLEIFKFSLYLFVPIAALIHFGDPAWYRTTVVPYRDKLFPPLDRTNQRIPTDQAGVRAEIARIKAERIARRAQREEERKNVEQ